MPRLSLSRQPVILGDKSRFRGFCLQADRKLKISGARFRKVKSLPGLNILSTLSTLSTLSINGQTAMRFAWLFVRCRPSTKSDARRTLCPATVCVRPGTRRSRRSKRSPCLSLSRQPVILSDKSRLRGFCLQAETDKRPCDFHGCLFVYGAAYLGFSRRVKHDRFFVGEKIDIRIVLRISLIARSQMQPEHNDENMKIMDWYGFLSK